MPEIFAAERATRTPVRGLPSDVESEQAVLGSILMDETALSVARGVLKPADFYLDKHAWIYEAMEALALAGQPVDLLSLSRALEAGGKLDEVGGPSYLTGLANGVPTSVHVAYYAGRVLAEARRRSLVRVSTEICADAYESEFEAAYPRALRRLLEVGETARVADNGFMGTGEILDEFWPDMLAGLESGEVKTVVGLATGLGDLDRLTGGLTEGSYTIVAGRPSMGKTSFLLSVLKNVAENGYRAGMASLEMGRKQLIQRLISMETRIPLIELQLQGRYDQGNRLRPFYVSEIAYVREATDKIRSLPLFIDDTPAQSPAGLYLAATNLAAKQGLDFLEVDYINLVTTDEVGGESRARELEKISANLKGMAKTLKIPVVAAAQLNRAVETRDGNIPMMSDLRDSGGQEQTADGVWFLYRKDYYDQQQNPHHTNTNIAQVIVAKDRNLGRLGTLDFYFREGTAEYRDIREREGPVEQFRGRVAH